MNSLPSKVERQIKEKGLPTSGTVPFEPQLDKNRQGDSIIRREAIQYGPKKGKRGFVDTAGRIWVKCWAHGSYPDHWDVQEDGGTSYFRVDLDGNLLP